MRNHLATDVLGSKMLSLFQHFKEHLKDEGNKLDPVIQLLEVTSSLVNVLLQHTFETSQHLRATCTAVNEGSNFFPCLGERIR